MEGLQTTAPDSSSGADQQFHFVANSLARLLETATREFERDREAAKASLATPNVIIRPTRPAKKENRFMGRTPH